MSRKSGHRFSEKDMRQSTNLKRVLTTQQIRRIADQSGARDIGKVEVDIILTHLLQLFHERGITEHVAFKGGTMLRKMVFGPRGRYSTDLDFTLCSNSTDEQVMEMIQDALHAPWQGIGFKLADKDWGFTDGSFFANPVCSHAGNEKGIKINIQVSLREKPILSVRPLPQIVQGYFKELASEARARILRPAGLRPLAVTTATRVSSLPDVPTVNETVSGYQASGWTGVAVRKGTSSDVIDRLTREISAGLARGQGAAGRDRQRDHAAHARGVRCVRDRRNREMGQGGQALRRQAGVISF